MLCSSSRPRSRTWRKRQLSTNTSWRSRLVLNTAFIHHQSIGTNPWRLLHAQHIGVFFPALHPEECWSCPWPYCDENTQCCFCLEQKRDIQLLKAYMRAIRSANPNLQNLEESIEYNEILEWVYYFCSLLLCPELCIAATAYRNPAASLTALQDVILDKGVRWLVSAPTTLCSASTRLVSVHNNLYCMLCFDHLWDFYWGGGSKVLLLMWV